MENTSTSTDAPHPKLAPNGNQSLRHGASLVAPIISGRYRSLAGGLTKCSGLLTPTGSLPTNASFT